MGYTNPILRLPAAQRIARLPAPARALLADLLRDLSRDADEQAERSWRTRKAPMAAYWRACAVYCRHIARALEPHRGAVELRAVPGSVQSLPTLERHRGRRDAD